MLKRLKDYFKLIKFSHTIFAMPFALVGSYIGYIDSNYSVFPYKLLFYVVLCMFFARSAAMSFNRYADAYFDALNPRTKDREIPTGVFNRRHALIFTILNSIFFVTITYFINNIVFYLSPVALFIILAYSYTKRFTILCHLWLGVSLALSPIGSYLVFTKNFAWEPIFYSFVVLFWVSGFDIIYSIQDIDFDKKMSLKSIPSKLGPLKSLNIALLFHIVAISLTVIIGILFKKHIFYWIGVIIFAMLLIYEFFIVKKSFEANKINKVFSLVNSFAGLLYGIFVIIDIALF